MIKIPAFTKSYHRKQVVHTEPITLKEDTIYAVIGANGSGKSTWSRMVCGITKPDKGDMKFLKGLRPGYLAQKSHVYRMSVKKNLMLNGNDEERAEDFLQALDLKRLADQKAWKLSGGEMSKMFLARILMGKYDLLILDEPSTAMDVESTLASEKLILDYKETYHGTILIITHSIEQAVRIADRVICFDHGSICEEGSADEVLKSPKREETRRFLSFLGADFKTYENV